MRLIFSLVGPVLLLACGDADEHDHPQHATGAQLYNEHCAPCHKESGAGAFLEGVPALKVTAMSYRQLIDFIRGHRRDPGTRMPRFRAMPEAEAASIAIHIRRRLAPG